MLGPWVHFAKIHFVKIHFQKYTSLKYTSKNTPTNLLAELGHSKKILCFAQGIEKHPTRSQILNDGTRIPFYVGVPDFLGYV